MGNPRWPDGAPIQGVTVIPGEQGLDSRFELDFDLSPPQTASEAAHSGVLSALHAQYGFLPNEPSMIRESDLLDIDVCMSFAEELIKPLGYDEAYEVDLILALTCVCFRDEQLSKAALLFDTENDEAAVERFNIALNSIIAESLH